MLLHDCFLFSMYYLFIPVPYQPHPMHSIMMSLCFFLNMIVEHDCCCWTQVDPDNVRPVEFNALLEAEKVAEATKLAIKRKIAQAASVDFQSRSLPAKLRIEPDDSEDVVSAYIYYFYNAWILLVSATIKWHWLIAFFSFWDLQFLLYFVSFT